MQIMFLQDLNCQKQHGSLLECVCTCACVHTLVNIGVHVCVAQYKIYDCSKECWKRKDEIVVPLKKYPTSVRAHNLFTSTCKVSLG